MACLENSEIAALFAEMADLLQIDGGDRHRVSAFRRAARIIEGLPRPAEEMLGHGELAKVRGVGQGTIRRVKQMLRTHSCDDLDKLRRKVGPGLREMLKIKGLGPTTVRNLHHRLGIETIDQLEYAAKAGAVEAMPRMGTGMVHKILAGIEAYRRRRGKIPLIESLRVGRRLAAELGALPEAAAIELAGSVRRGKAAIGDLDILIATCDPGPIVSRFVTLADVESILVRGEGRCSVRLRNQQQADLRLLPPQSFGAGLHYFTGSKGHNIELRKRANRMGLKISDKGLFRRSDEALLDPCTRELDVFARLGLPWIPPELRENRGEFEAAERGRLPRLITDEDLRGDLHMHTTDSDGKGSVRDMAQRARELGHEYIAITDHSKALRIARGLDEAGLARQMEAVRELDAQLEGVRVLTGIEVDILADGSLDLDPALLAQLDWVIASVHQWTNQDRETMTRRVLRAIETGVVDCVGHPTGRRPGKRDPYPIDLDKLIHGALEHEVALECNGGPNRMDLGDVECRRCRERGVMVAIHTDAHAPRHLGRHEFGLAMARRGWLEPGHVLNAQAWDWIAERRAKRLRDHGQRAWRVSPVVAQVPMGVVLDEGDEDDQDGIELPLTDEGERGVLDDEAHAWGEGEGEDEGEGGDDDEEPEAEAGAKAGRAEAEVEVEAAGTPTSRSSEVDLAFVLALQLRALNRSHRARLEAWLMGEQPDPVVEAALAEFGDNPLQVGFDLLSEDED